MIEQNLKDLMDERQPSTTAVTVNLRERQIRKEGSVDVQTFSRFAEGFRYNEHRSKRFIEISKGRRP